MRLLVKVTMPRLVPLAPVFVEEAAIGQPLTPAGDELQVPETAARATLVPLQLSTTVTMALQVTCRLQQQQQRD